MKRIIHSLGAWLAAAAALLVASCGGGVGSGGTGSFSSFSTGPITGYGSIFVNGVRYEIDGLRDGTDDLVDEDGNGLAKSRLLLGATVQVKAGTIDASGATPTATARQVVLGSEVLGRIESATADASGVTLAIAGQTVRVTAGVTVLDERFGNGLADLVAGRFVEVYGAYDAQQQQIVATRIEPTDPTSAMRVRGTVANLGASTFTIGGGTYVFGSLPGGVTNGSIVRLRIDATQSPDAQGRWVVRSFATGGVRLPSEAGEAEVEGRVTSVDGLPARFAVDGVPVDASGVSTAGVAVGVRVEVEGSVVNGTLVARKIEIKSDGDGTTGELEFKGTIATLDTTAKTLTLVGRTDLIRYGSASVEGTMAVGRPVEIKGKLGSDSQSIDATEVHVEG